MNGKNQRHIHAILPPSLPLKRHNSNPNSFHPLSSSCKSHPNLCSIPLLCYSTVQCLFFSVSTAPLCLYQWLHLFTSRSKSCDIPSFDPSLYIYASLLLPLFLLFSLSAFLFWFAMNKCILEPLRFWGNEQKTWKLIHDHDQLCHRLASSANK